MAQEQEEVLGAEGFSVSPDGTVLVSGQRWGGLPAENPRAIWLSSGTVRGARQVGGSEAAAV